MGLAAGGGPRRRGLNALDRFRAAVERLGGRMSHCAHCGDRVATLAFLPYEPLGKSEIAFATMCLRCDCALEYPRIEAAGWD